MSVVELERHLVLNNYFLDLLGFRNFEELKEVLKGVKEGYSQEGVSFFAKALIDFNPTLESELLNHDLSIRNCVEKLRKSRRVPDFNLKYFQYAAVLLTELFLNRYFTDRKSFIFELNEFLKSFVKKRDIEIEPFNSEDLKRLSYWMATGSGKTLIMHINYWQILNYSNCWDNIILVTPNEGLSRQHFEQFKLSGIPCKLYRGDQNSLKTEPNQVLIIDVHKLSGDKRGKVKVEVSQFEGRNLVFIDEGHKGAGGESEEGWKRLRERLAKEGFLLEYSATFGQIIEFSKSGKPKRGSLALYNEYSKSIIFDYSYKHFYQDGFGKDFYILNLRNKEGGYQELLLMASLLSYLEQLLIYRDFHRLYVDYNLEKPLWVFVGNSVVKSRNSLVSDIIKIISFLKKVLEDEGYGKKLVTEFLSSQLIEEELFKRIKELEVNEILEGIHNLVFSGRGKLELFELKRADGEIGLRSSGGYFGVINVGDVKALKSLLIKEGISVKEDHLVDSLFQSINTKSSNINLLIGSKKFIEGWNSWRVSNMCLMNIGKGEGPQVIQLFGRGVRLKGKDFSLRREPNPDYNLKVLQTLFIFGLNADYINLFLKSIEREGVKPNRKLEFKEKATGGKPRKRVRGTLKLKKDDAVIKGLKVKISPTLSISKGLNFRELREGGRPVKVPKEYFNLLDWQDIYLKLLSFKESERLFNLTFDLETLKEIVLDQKYKILASQTEGIELEGDKLRINSFKGVEELQMAVFSLLKSYLKKWYLTFGSN